MTIDNFNFIGDTCNDDLCGEGTESATI